ncbi:hypothetical protein QR680_015873 [Steinernema hermaphroditum]|uniref:Dolichyl-diphosphooligosaccharide--protein glycosyltransferase subunit 2 n=1 Tax=Steinernema hermaphroditum TaxID=289476 RepID=A0AA39HBT4_9BILA|nr:hypothetical protein QR680_015873 [Steinernema hermaphroditum]
MSRASLLSLIVASALVSLALAAAGKTEITLGNIQYQLGEDSTSTWNSVKLNEKLTTIPALTQHGSLSIKFAVNDKATGKPFPVHQAFVAFVHAETLQEIIFIAELDPANVYVAEIDLKKERDQFHGLSGVYNVRLIIGDFAVPLGINWNLMDVKVTVPKVAAPVVKKSQQIIYEKLPEINHIFREPEARPPQVVSTAFTFICLAPFALLIILWLRVGINFESGNVSIWTIPFFAGFGGIFVLYTMFWLQLNMFQTLNYLFFIGSATFFFGNRLLRVVAAQRKPSDGVAVVAERNEVYSYNDLAAKVGRYSALLNGKYGLKKGDRILARTSKSVDNMSLYLASLAVGAMYIPLNPAYTAKETNHFVKDAEPTIFVTSTMESDEVFRDSVKYVLDERVVASEASKMSPILDMEYVKEDDVAVVCYTSGTTGNTGAMITHGNLSAGGQALAHAWQFTKKDRLLHMLPFYHVHGMFLSLSCTLISKSTVIFRPKFTMEDALRWMPDSTVFMGVPTFYSRLLHSTHFDADFTRHMRLFVSGSAPLSLPLWQEFRQRTGKAILERYGMTEAMVICSNPYDAPRKPGTVGPALEGAEVRLGTDGVVEVKSPSIFKGYWRLPEKTKKEFTSDGFFITGDNGAIDSEGYVTILGRNKDLVISGGLNVYPKEIEDVFDAVEFVKESAIIGCPHSDFGEAVVAVCAVDRAEIEKLNGKAEDFLKNYASNELATYKRPKKYVFVDVLPRNSMGKVQKKVLRETYQNLFA